MTIFIVNPHFLLTFPPVIYIPLSEISILASCDYQAPNPAAFDMGFQNIHKTLSSSFQYFLLIQLYNFFPFTINHHYTRYYCMISYALCIVNKYKSVFFVLYRIKSNPPFYILASYNVYILDLYYLQLDFYSYCRPY